MSRRLLFALLAVSVLIAAAPIAAQAQVDEQTPEREQLTERDAAGRLERAKAHVTHQIERRLDAIDRLGNKVANAKHITDGHAASLRADYAAASAILTAGIDAVAGTETFEELRRITPPIFEDTLVFALLGPKTHAVVASDAVVGLSARYDGLATKLQEALDRLAADGVDVVAAQANLDAAVALVAEASASGGAVADSVIGLQPGDEIAEPLADAKATLQRTRSQLGEARNLTKTVAEFIRSQVGDTDNG